VLEAGDMALDNVVMTHVFAADMSKARRVDTSARRATHGWRLP
jgi:hypothetical protein